MSSKPSSVDSNVAPPANARRSAGIVVVRRRDNTFNYLLLRAYRNWDFPKGSIEPEETPLEAAIRETTEETGLTELAFSWGEHYCDTEPYAGGKIARYYIAESTAGEVELPVSAALGRPEHHQFAWMAYADARRHLVSRLQRVLDWAALILAEDERPTE